MIVESWKYKNNIVRCVEYHAFREYGLFPDGSLSRIVDLGWDRLESMVHTWVNSLNNASAKIYQKTGTGCNKLKLNKKTFDLLWIGANEYFDFFESKLKHYEVEISGDVEDNTVNICVNDKVEGKINIVF